MLDDDELMYTRILNHNATPLEITDYIDKLHKEIKELKDKLYQISYYDNLLEKINDKIEEIKILFNKENGKKTINFYLYKYVMDILQELLEEE